MCEPVTILTIAAAGMSAMGDLYAGDAQANAANHQAKVYEINARDSEDRARDAILRGNDEQRKQMEMAGQLRGRQLASQAANGLDTTYGSAFDLALDTAGQAELDKLTIRSNSYREAGGLQAEAASARAGAAGARSSAKAAKTASYLGGVGTLLGGAAGAYGSYTKSTGLTKAVNTAKKLAPITSPIRVVF